MILLCLLLYIFYQWLSFRALTCNAFLDLFSDLYHRLLALMHLLIVQNMLCSRRLRLFNKYFAIGLILNRQYLIFARKKFCSVSLLLLRLRRLVPFQNTLEFIPIFYREQIFLDVSIIGALSWRTRLQICKHYVKFGFKIGTECVGISLWDNMLHFKMLLKVLA